jgi:hypothetical protein
LTMMTSNSRGKALDLFFLKVKSVFNNLCHSLS